MALILYPKVIVKAKSFKGAEVVTVPNQSMTLLEIIRRFTRNESLPVQHEGTYDTRFGDVEKMKNLDLVERQEYIDRIKSAVQEGEQREAKRLADEAELKKKRAAEKKQKFVKDVKSVIDNPVAKTGGEP